MSNFFSIFSLIHFFVVFIFSLATGIELRTTKSRNERKTVEQSVFRYSNAEVFRHLKIFCQHKDLSIENNVLINS